MVGQLHHLKGPNLLGRVTKMKMVLPVGKRRAWELIATPEGLASWFSLKCIGQVKPGRFLTLGWRGGQLTRFKILYVGKQHSSFRLIWKHGAQIRFYLHGKMTTLTLEVEYQKYSNRQSLSNL